jgi:uncharacterized protein YdaU (DUF1376 family)
MHHYSRHVGDYRKDTPHLSQAQHGAFTLLLDWYYASEKPLPNDLDLLCRIAAAVKTDERKNIETVLGYFFVLKPDNCWHQKRCDKEIAVYQARSRGGKDGMKSRYSTPNSESNSTPNSESNNQRVREPRTKNQEPRTNTIVGSASESQAETDSKQPSDLSARSLNRTLLLEALITVCGGDPRLTTKSGWGAAGKALKEIQTVEPELTPDHLRSAAAAYRERWPEIDITPMALTHNWALFSPRSAREPLPPPRSEGRRNVNFEKNGGGGPAPAGNPLTVPPCFDWKPILKGIAEKAGCADDDFLADLEILNWQDAPSSMRQSVWDEWQVRDQGGAPA